MLPIVTDISDAEEEVLASKTFKLKEENIAGYTESMEQAIYCILNTERYDNIIYSWDYGIETKDLIGSDSDYIIAVLPERITDALLQDDRITDVTDFEFEVEGNAIHCYFTVWTTQGNIEYEKVVSM